MSTPLAGSIALVTGASRGLGAATAIELARLGAHVVLLARTEGGLAETDDAIRALGQSATLVPMDLTQGTELDAIGPSLHARFGRLDAWVHAAGQLGTLTPVSHITPETWEATLAVNAGSTYRLIRTLDPLLRSAEAGRAVILASHRATDPAPFWGLYAATMAARRALALAWAAEVQNTALRVNLFDPVRAATRFRRAAYPGETPDASPAPATIAPEIAALCLPGEMRQGNEVKALLF